MRTTKCNFRPIGMFMDCFNLSSIILPSNIVTIGQQSYQNTNITSITIPDSVEILGQQCFKNCRKLNTITINDQSNLSRIDYGVFDGCLQFSHLNSFRAKNFVSNYGALYNLDMTKM